MSTKKVNEKFDPEKYGMVYCSECWGSGRSFDGNRKGVNVCRVCGGFGLLKKEEKKVLPE